MTLAEKSIDPRVKRTRKLLVESFLELLQEKSFNSISIQDITKRAMVNRATFYAHFTDKYMLLDFIFRQHFQEIVANKIPPSSSWGMQNLRLLVEAVLNHLDGFHRYCRPTDGQYHPSIGRVVQEELAVILLRWLKQVKPVDGNSQVRIETIASIMSWAIFGTAAEWSLNKGTRSAQEMATQILGALSESGAYIGIGAN